MRSNFENERNFENNEDNLLTSSFGLYVPLLPTLTRNGFDYTLVQRGNNAMIYKQTADEMEAIYYEVFRRIISRPKNIKGKIIPARERFPKSNDFGSTAWTYRSLEEAMRKFSELERS